jgi:hypothetical protein
MYVNKHDILDIVNTLSKVPGYKISFLKSVVFLYTNNGHTKKEYKKTIPFILASKKPNKIARNKLNKGSEKTPIIKIINH